MLARSKEPLLSPSEDNREGYVPNVIYTCGALRCGEWIFMPYGVADSSIHFASIKIRDLLAHLGYDCGRAEGCGRISLQSKKTSSGIRKRSFL